MSNDEKSIGEKLQEARKECVAEARNPYIMFGGVKLFWLRASRAQFSALKESRLKE
jgi:hypothetical protein